MTKVASGYGQKSMLIADNCQRDATQAPEGHAGAGGDVIIRGGLASFGSCPFINHAPIISSTAKQKKALQRDGHTRLSNGIRHFTDLLFQPGVARALLLQGQCKDRNGRQWVGKKENHMKRIEAIIRPEKASEVCAALDKAGHPGVTLSQVEGHGDQKSWVNHVRGISYKVRLTSKTRVEVVVKDEDADKIINAIRDAALTGEVGDGKIFVHDMANVIRIRTNEAGMAAI